MTHTSTPNLPTPADYTAAVTALVAAQEAVEAITWQLREISESYDEHDTTAPTADDVVAVFTLVDELDRTTADLDAKRRQLQRTLHSINLARLEFRGTA